MVDVIDFDLVVSEGSGFVETDGFQTSTLDCFLRLCAYNSVSVEPFQTESVD